MAKAQDKIIDISLEIAPKTKFRINGDDNKIIELNISDTGIVSRMEDGYNRLTDCMTRIADVDLESEDFASQLEDINTEMCAVIDYIFDSNVSFICDGNLYDPYGGEFNFEHIIEALLKLYSDNMELEYKKIKARVQKHTAKYTK